MVRSVEFGMNRFARSVASNFFLHIVHMQHKSGLVIFGDDLLSEWYSVTRTWPAVNATL